MVVPDYKPDWKHKIVRSAPTGGIVVFSLVVEKPDGTQETHRFPSEAYRLIIAATNMKQRVRKLMEYSYADKLHYAVVGTPNLLEFDQGFFVKGGDGLADIKPIAGLYKSQVYAMARHLGLPDPIASRQPTTETFSIPQTQEEFYFGHPYDRMDLLVWGEKHDVPADRPRAADGHRRRGRATPPTRRSSACATRRPTCTPTRSRSSRARPTDVCGIAGIVRPDGARPVEEVAAAQDGAGDPPPRARRVRAGARSERRLRLHTSGHLRHRRTAGSRCSRRTAGRSSSTTARSSTTRSCAPSSRVTGSTWRRRATPRSCCACWSATASRRSTAATASSRSPGGSRARAGSRSCATASASTRCTGRCSTTARSCSARRPRRCSPPARSRPRPTWAASTTSSRRGPRARRARRSAACTCCRPGAAHRLGARRIVAERTVVEAGLRRRAPRRPATWSRSCARASSCACAPTSPSARYLSGGLDSSLTTALAQAGLRPPAAHVLASPSRTRTTTSARIQQRGRGEARDRSPRRGCGPGGDRRTPSPTSCGTPRPR